MVGSPTADSLKKYLKFKSICLTDMELDCGSEVQPSVNRKLKDFQSLLI